jgi:hypothetical protein
MGLRPSHQVIQGLRKALSEVEATNDPDWDALISLKSIILRRLADIEISDAAKEAEPLDFSPSLIPESSR